MRYWRLKILPLWHVRTRKGKYRAASVLAGLMAPMLIVTASATDGDIVTRSSVDHQTYWVEQIAEGINFPSSIVWLPNGDMLITERGGNLRIVREGKLDPRPVSGVPPSVSGGTDGLKDILLDPDYRSNQTLYLFLSEGTFEERYAAVYRARNSTVGLQNVIRIFRTKDAKGTPGAIAERILFLSDKTLLVAVAEDQKKRAQLLDSHIGKILRINRDGSIPKDNPFLNVPGALPEIWSYGHRVQLGLYQDVEDGEIWEVESGPRGGDELNLLKAGGNFGWAKATWGFSYKQGLDAPAQSVPGIENPILVWMPSVTPSGLTRYRGRTYPLWDGDYFVGHLTTKELERLRIKGKRVVLQERLLLDLEERIREVKIGPDNYLYVLTDHQNGRLLRLQPGRPNATQLARVARKLEQPAFPPDSESETPVTPSDIVQGRKIFLERCAACHKLGTLVPGGEIGPDLDGVYGSFTARKTDFEYSENLADSAWKWNFVTLNKFLSNPGGFVVGTKMVAPPVTDAEERRNIIGFLKQQSLK